MTGEKARSKTDLSQVRRGSSVIVFSGSYLVYIYDFFMNVPQSGHRRYLCYKKKLRKKKKGMCSMEKEQKIRMCIQTYVNLYGVVPSAQELLEWLGVSYEDMIPEFFDQKIVA